MEYDLIHEIPNFVTAEELTILNAAFQKHLNFNDVTFNDVGVNSNRQGQTINVSATAELKEADEILYKKFSSDKVQEIIAYFLNPDLVFGYGDTGYEFHRYHPGHVCQEHRDGEFIINHNDRSDSLLRFASVVLHLNTCVDGGELVFPSLNKTVKTEAGKLVIFPPYGWAKHYTTASTETRDVIVTWLVYNNISVNRLDKLKDYYKL